MFTIHLLKKFISNSLIAIDLTSKIPFLLETKSRVAKLLKGMETCFYGDKSVIDKKNKNIYTLIKREYMAAVQNNDYSKLVKSREELKRILFFVELELSSLHIKCV